MNDKIPGSLKNQGGVQFNETADLTYYIVEGVLTGVVNGKGIHMIALSGGGGGSTKNPASGGIPGRSAVVMNNPYMEGLKTVGSGKTHVHGGPIPPGSYSIETPEKHGHLGLSARLDSLNGNKPMGRDGFYIHGRGPHGSDGCIVPVDAHQFNQLMKDLETTEGGRLVVVEAMDGSRYA